MNTKEIVISKKNMKYQVKFSKAILILVVFLNVISNMLLKDVDVFLGTILNLISIKQFVTD